ncbi:4-hydroxybenzoate polyprenyltransferase, mitochondrial-like [Ruditapes philippinarum]|uniref:4-hydroxybenzoate polyprenyltransferase, mitochondrial-like n=1 Tax=Ruditapes philippinarum TaxID=129788 RepID=UPI00295BE79E|nr:4-hydroxybenzoate polyprenyltransferase, mitochondrial-like [Ruditapes philippinarum]XP_060584094.1 4-hydroxybenzoate polyprenyltransferase, mitochondrial-like [Ruditapes philippinarum]
MEANFLLNKLKVVGQLKQCLNIPKQTCERHLHTLINDGRYRSGQSWCKYRYNRKTLLSHNWNYLAASGVPVYLMRDRFSEHQHRDIYHLCDKNRLQKYNKRLGHGLFLPASNVSIQHRPVSFGTKAILDASPPKVQPYLRLLRFDKPIGTYLLFWPCTWSIGLAAQAGHLPDLYLLALFGLGSLIMRGSGCIINDMWDRDIDKKVERTKTRPLASGELTPFQALVFLGGNLSLALAILLQLNWNSVFLGAASMILVIAYPLAKRYTYWPQVVLGVTLNWGVLIAWSALKGSLEWPVLPLYTACVVYTMFYDTIYSHQDKYDDMLIGVKSTALKFGDQTKIWLTGFSSMMIGCLTLTGHMCDQTWPYYTAVALTGTHLAHQLYTVDLNNPEDCLKKFKSNTQLGAVLFIGIVMGTLLKPKEKENEETS